MDTILSNLTSQAMNYAIRSGITITTTYAIKQCTRLVRETKPGSQHREELLTLQQRLESKIRILSPSIDMIELISARGNTTLESAVSLTKGIRMDMQRLGVKVAQVAEEEECAKRKDGPRGKISNEKGVVEIIAFIKTLLVKIEDAIPLINLAITTSGVNLSTKLSGTISPSRLLQASTFLTAADAKYTVQPGSRQQVGPSWTVSLYMLFAGHANRAVGEDGVREATWKEVVHKARVKLVRVPLEGLYHLSERADREHVCQGMIPAEAKASEFAYQLVIVEDLDDDRVHTFDEAEESALPGPFEDVENAGIRDVVPIHEISKIFYADTGKMLNIGSDDDDTNNPVLLLRRDVHAEPPRRMLHRSPSQMSGHYSSKAEQYGVNGHAHDDDDEQSEIDAQIHRESTPNTPLRFADILPPSSPNWRLPADLDPEWMAFEVYVEEPDSEDDLEDSVPASRPSSSGRQDSLSPSVANAISDLKLQSPSPHPNNTTTTSYQPTPHQVFPTPKPLIGPQIKTSLSLLEMLLKLTTLQQFRQDSHLTIEDELLNFFLEDSATAGAGPDKEFRQRLRHDAVRRVGFDPYDESPVKRRGEEYIAYKRGKVSPGREFDVHAFQGRLSNGQARLNEGVPTLEFVRPSIEQPYSSPIASPASVSPSATDMVQQRSRDSRPNAVESTSIRRGISQAKYGTLSPSPQGSILATPPTIVGREAFLRAQSEPKPGSPLTRQLIREDNGGSM